MVITLLHSYLSAQIQLCLSHILKMRVALFQHNIHSVLSAALWLSILVPITSKAQLYLI